MGFSDSIQYCLGTGYFKISGRASRSEFWWFQLFSFFAMLLLAILSKAFDSEIIAYISLFFVIPSWTVFLGVCMI